MDEHILDDYDVKLVGPTSEIRRYRESVAAAVRANDEVASMLGFLRESGRTVTRDDLDTMLRTLARGGSAAPPHVASAMADADARMTREGAPVVIRVGGEPNTRKPEEKSNG